jgi:hypothetical protein
MKTQQEKNKEIELVIHISIFMFVISIILGSIFTYFAPKNQKITGFTTILSIGIMIAAFSPQLYLNFIQKSNATNHVLAIFLILCALGVLLRVPGLRQQLGNAFSTNKGKFLVILITISNLIPLCAHLIWQWQGAIYDTKVAYIPKHILEISAPISTIIVILAVIWLFSIIKV